mgnify:CR=1 FL=1
MANLTDEIEKYIQELLIQAHEQGILLRRNDLAAEIKCAPSQISYVLATRFTSDRGYIVESRRGSGGYVRICRIGRCHPVLQTLETEIGKEIDVLRLRALLEQLQQENKLTRRETELIYIVLGGSYLPLSNDTRATLLKVLISTLGHGVSYV